MISIQPCQLGGRPYSTSITLFLANFAPLPISHFVTHPGTPQKYVTHLRPPIFSRPSTNPDKSPLYKFSLNCSRGFLSGEFCLLSGRFCPGCLLSIPPPSVRMHVLQQKAKHHFKIHVSYMHDTKI